MNNEEYFLEEYERNLNSIIEVEFRGVKYNMTRRGYYEIGQAWTRVQEAVTGLESGTHALLNELAARNGIRLRTFVEVMELCQEVF